MSIFKKKKSSYECPDCGFYYDTPNHELGCDGRKKYLARVEIIESGEVIYSKTTKIAKAENRLQGVQALEEQVMEIWKNLMQTFHIVNRIESSKEGSEKE